MDRHHEGQATSEGVLIFVHGDGEIRRLEEDHRRKSAGPVDERTHLPQGVRRRLAPRLSLFGPRRWNCGARRGFGRGQMPTSRARYSAQELFEFAAFDDPQCVVAGREGLGFCADPCRGGEDSGCCSFSSTDPARVGRVDPKDQSLTDCITGRQVLDRIGRTLSQFRARRRRYLR
jgi:hypothetical protein